MSVFSALQMFFLVTRCDYGFTKNSLPAWTLRSRSHSLKNRGRQKQSDGGAVKSRARAAGKKKDQENAKHSALKEIVAPNTPLGQTRDRPPQRPSEQQQQQQRHN
jgi:hypothetical protein